MGARRGLQAGGRPAGAAGSIETRVTGVSVITIFRKRLVFVVTAAVLACGLAAIVCLCSCTGTLAQAIVKAPNHGDSFDPSDDAGPDELSRLGVDRQLRFAVGPPDASLAVWVIEPDKSGGDGEGDPAGTVLVLHGIRDEKDHMLGMGRLLARAGYRAVLVDHRGHGRSSGDWMTYGVVESRDLVQVLDALSAMGLAGGAIGVLGFSYGGAIAIQLAALDPRVRAVIALAAFASLEEVVPVYVRRFLPAWIIPEGRIADAVEQAGAIAGFDPADASPIDAITRTAAHVLLIHGSEDAKIPFSHSERMQAAAGERALLVLVDGEGHDSLLADGDGVVARWTLEWFGRWLGE